MERRCFPENESVVRLLRPYQDSEGSTLLYFDYDACVLATQRLSQSGNYGHMIYRVMV